MEAIGSCGGDASWDRFAAILRYAWHRHTVAATNPKIYLIATRNNAVKQSTCPDGNVPMAWLSGELQDRKRSAGETV